VDRPVHGLKASGEAEPLPWRAPVAEFLLIVFCDKPFSNGIASNHSWRVDRIADYSLRGRFAEEIMESATLGPVHGSFTSDLLLLQCNIMLVRRNKGES
jgi:hypothetical protein